MNGKEKRGLSPVIATVLLIGIALVLATIVFIWARHFVGEAITKEGEAIELVCDDVSFEAEAFGSEGKLYLENKGSVPIHRVEIRELGLFGEVSVSESFSGVQVSAGETKSVDLPTDIESGDEIIVVPILVGEVEGVVEKKSHVCDGNYGQRINVR